MDISRFAAPGLQSPKVTAKQKTNQILSATLEKVKFCFFKKTVYKSFRQGITMEKCKAKGIQVDLGIVRHILAYSDIFKHKEVNSGNIRVYWDIFRTLCNPGVFRTLVYSELEAYSEPWCIQNSGIFRILVHSEPCQTSTMEHLHENS